MNFDLTEEQRLLQDALAGYLRRHYRFEDRVRTLAAGTWRSDHWRAYAQELGLFRATLPVEAGGFGGGGIETLVIAEQFGAVLALEPYIEAMVLGLSLLRAAGGAADPLVMPVVDASILVIPALHESSGRFSPTRLESRAEAEGAGWRITGGKVAVAGGPAATHFLVSARTAPVHGQGHSPGEREGVSLFLVEANSSAVRRDDYRLLDGRGATDLTLDGADGILLGTRGGAAAAIEAALDAAVAALCAESVGIMQSMLDQTVEHAKQRQQFGQSIARFQVLQHRMVDMLTQLEQSRSLAIMAALALGMPAPERRRAVCAAKAFVSDAVVFVAQAAVQIHGAIGTTEECAISHYFRRATVISSQFGTAAYHRGVMAELADSTLDRRLAWTSE